VLPKTFDALVTEFRNHGFDFSIDYTPRSGRDRAYEFTWRAKVRFRPGHAQGWIVLESEAFSPMDAVVRIAVQLRELANLQKTSTTSFMYENAATWALALPLYNDDAAWKEVKF
jgi:hypothetical protein